MSREQHAAPDRPGGVLALLRCSSCGTPMRYDAGRYVCPGCGAEVRLDEHGEECWVAGEGGGT